MDWSSFQTHGDSKERAFEAFVGHLFERWVRHEYPDLAGGVVFVDGSGGDGGTEAYARLANGELVADQAKWFRESLGGSEFKQIERSVRKAIKVRKGLVRYIVAIPRGLADPKDAAKAGTPPRRKKTAQDRWSELRAKIKLDHPNVSVELWDETRLEELMAQLTSDGLRCFWFSKSAFRPDLLEQTFKQSKAGWLSTRYLPDLHVEGTIESDLALRLDDSTERAQLLGVLSGHSEAIHGLLGRLAHIAEFPRWKEVEDGTALLNAATSRLATLAEGLDSIVAQMKGGSSVRELRGTDLAPVSSEVQRLAIAIGSVGERWNVRPPIHQFKADLEAGLRTANRSLEVANALGDLSRPVLYVGDPGSGKTHAMAHAVEHLLNLATPALLLRARNLAVSQGWGEILRSHLDIPQWSAAEILDCLETKAVINDVRLAALGATAEAPTPAFIGLDGLDESVDLRADWRERLAELATMAATRPRIRIAATVRSQVAEEFRTEPAKNGFSSHWLDEASDAPIAELFSRYVKQSRVKCPPLFRWFLRSPIEIRLFGELYEGLEVSDAHPDILSLPWLLDLKICQTEEEIRTKLNNRWSPSIEVVRPLMLAIARETVTSGQAIPTERVTELVAEELRPRSLLSPLDIVSALDACAEAGLLLRRSQPRDHPLESVAVLWEPAIQVVSDFLLGYALAQRTKASIDRGPDDDPNLDPPEGSARDLMRLLQRGGASQVAATLLLQDGISVCDTAPWSDLLDPTELERLQMAALPAVAISRAAKFTDWFSERLVADMPSCRRALRRTVIPVLRIPGHPLGARCIDSALRKLGTAKRDLFWSGPSYLPESQGMPWEGHGEPALEDLWLEPDDAWDGAPLLMTWGLTTVVLDQRLRRRREIAQWGAVNAIGLRCLLQHFEGTDDPQLMEDLAWSAYGAATLAVGGAGWEDLCAWIVGSAFSKVDSAAVRHAAKGLVARCVATGLATKHSEHPRVIAADRLLALDPSAAETERCEMGIHESVDYDLAKYVALRALEPFFRDWLRSNQFHPLGAVPRQSGERLELLQRQAKTLGRDDLNEGQLVLGYAVQRARDLGWNENDFYGEPRGGEAGERLGADIAVLREHPQGRHGTRSPVAKFIDKYTRCTVQECVGFLADRLPAMLADGLVIQPPVDVALVSDPLPNPAVVDTPEREEMPTPPAPPWVPRNIAPDFALGEASLLDRSLHQSENAPVPDLTPCLVLNEFGGPSELEWLVLSGFFVDRSFPVPVDGAVWVSAFAVAQDVSLKVVQDRAGDGWDRRLAEERATIRATRFYVDPVEALWAPWIVDAGADVEIGGGFSALTVECMATALHWNTGLEERELWLPERRLREHLGLTNLIGGEMSDPAGRMIAAYRTHGRSWGEYPHCQVLAIRRDDLEAYLAAVERKIVWALRFYREPARVFTTEQPDGSWPPHVELNAYFWAEMQARGPRIVAGDRAVQKRDAVRAGRKKRR